MSVSMLRADDADKQRAFLALLARPLVTPWTDASNYALVHRHARVLEVWCRRLNYRLAHLEQCYRLRRLPLAGNVATPVRSHPGRAELLLGLYAAACLEDHREESITLQELSDMVRLSAAGRNGWPYDPDMRTHREHFVRALTWLVDQGVLEPRTDDQLREGWTQTGAGIGAGYAIHREALVLCIDTGDVDLALRPHMPDDADTRGVRLLRALVETQALYVAELTEDERVYLVSQRSRLVDQAQEMTGGIVEVRSDALLLAIPPDRELPGSLLMDFPSATAVDWACLSMIDRIAKATDGSFRTLALNRVTALATDLHAAAGDLLTKDLRESPQVVVRAVQERLTELGLLRVDDAVWTLTPLAGRYRDAALSTTADESPVGQDEFDLLEER